MITKWNETTKGNGKAHEYVDTIRKCFQLFGKPIHQLDLKIMKRNKVFWLINVMVQ